MSYEDTNCPCGGQKARETMLCTECLTTFADRPEMEVFNQGGSSEWMRHNAIILIALARRRKRVAT